MRVSAIFSGHLPERFLEPPNASQDLRASGSVISGIRRSWSAERKARGAAAIKSSLAGLSFMLQASIVMPASALAADPLDRLGDETGSWQRARVASPPAMVTGRVSVLDGHTLWFPAYAIKVRLAGIDGCDLSQWAFDPVRHGESSELKPLPCGALAKAWLQRTVGVQRVTCRVSSKTEPGTLVGACMAGGRDLAIEMLRVGWARAKGPSPFHSRYLAWQRHAMSARYGMWASYVLDRDEWRRKAVDTTTSRLPIADFNLLAERESEISPSFEDARKRPRRTDR